MRYKFYSTTEKAWDAMLEAIREARESVYLEMYIFVDNTPRHAFFEAIKRKAREGVRVKIIIDSFGSSELSREAVEEIRGSGAELMLFSRWFRHTHKKILIVDEKVAFIGGVNIHRLFLKWKDLQIRLEGPIVNNVICSFARTYMTCGGEDPSVARFCERGPRLGERARIWFLEHQPPSGKRLIRKHYRSAIARARKSIVIVTPYLFPRRWMVALLHQAVLRGVKVEMILPRRTDHRLFTKTNFFYISALASTGIRFYIQDEMNHAKVLLVDGKEGVVGSQNLDILSFDYGIEAGVCFREKEMVKDLKGIIEEWKADSVPFDPSMYREKWLDFLIAPVIRLFQTIM
ncbi:phosphatidylserine/phosphatidylglycerophosphate/cardiolipin synthase family protein [bacterium]|nr:phosphatidylserine/phosphatidylglycerophosphate/cardiolipin synthase family protein [bacterium]